MNANLKNAKESQRPVAAAKGEVRSFFGTLLDARHESGVAASTVSAKDPRPALLVDLYTEHQYLLRLLELLDELMPEISDASLRDFRSALARAEGVMQYLELETDPRHHVIEDLIADALLERGVMTKRMHQALKLAHANLAKKSRALDKSIRTVTEKQRETLEALVSDFTHAWRVHIKHEESDFFPMAARALTTEDWDSIEAKGGAARASLFEGAALERHADLLKYLRERVTQVGVGSSIPTLIQGASAVVEKLEVLSWGRYECYQALREQSHRIMAHQREAFRRLREADGLAAAVDTLRPWVEDSLNDALVTFKLPLPIIWKTGRTLIAPPRPPIPPSSRSNGKRRDAARGAGGQAQALNLALRLVLKPLLGRLNVEGINRMLQPAFDLFAPDMPRDVKMHTVKIGSVRAEWIVPIAAKSSRVLLYLPGGGFIFPASPQHRVLAARIGHAIEARSLLVPYRLAPKYPFPTCLEDCLAAYRQLLADGIDPQRIVIAGDSAGGGMTLSTLLALRDAGDPLPAAAILISPLADLSYSGASRVYNRWRDPMLPTARNIDMQDVFLKDIPATHPLASPVFGDYTGLPPILAQVGSTEMLLDDSLRVAARARAQAVPVEVEVWREMPHAWHLMDMLPETGRAIEHIAAFVRKHLPDGAEDVPSCDTLDPVRHRVKRAPRKNKDARKLVPAEI